mgnify:CR=1 FL=1
MSNGVLADRQGHDPHEAPSSPTSSCTSSSPRRRTSRATARAAATAACSCSASSKSRCWTATRTSRTPTARPRAMYGQYPPLVNASRPPGEWQAYDIVFTSPAFRAGRKLEKPAVVTVLHNGIVVHSGHAVLGTDGTQEDRPVYARQRQRPHRPAGSRQPGPLPQHLDQAAQRRRVTRHEKHNAFAARHGNLEEARDRRASRRSRAPPFTPRPTIRRPSSRRSTRNIRRR